MSTAEIADRLTELVREMTGRQRTMNWVKPSENVLGIGKSPFNYIVLPAGKWNLRE
jgi:hypothetical protein